MVFCLEYVFDMDLFRSVYALNPLLMCALRLRRNWTKSSEFL